jgi:tetrahydromethanopterin S-methyltransferase subunit B
MFGEPREPREETISLVVEELYERFDKLNSLLERIALALERIDKRLGKIN